MDDPQAAARLSQLERIALALFLSGQLPAGQLNAALVRGREAASTQSVTPVPAPAEGARPHAA